MCSMVSSKDFKENSYINPFSILLKYALQRYQAVKRNYQRFSIVKNFCNSPAKI